MFCLFREINSFSLCFKTGNLSAGGGKSTVKGLAATEKSKTDSPAQPDRQTSVHTVQVQPLDDVTFKLNENNDANSLLKKVYMITAVYSYQSTICSFTTVCHTKHELPDCTGIRRKGSNMHQ